MSDLDQLFVSGDQVDQSILAGILSPFLRIDKDSLSVVPTEKWTLIGNELRIILFLAARKAMKVRGLGIEKEGATPAEIEKEIGIKGGTLRPALKKLYDEKTISKSADSRYVLPSYSLNKVKATVEAWLKEQKNG